MPISPSEGWPKGVCGSVKVRSCVKWCKRAKNPVRAATASCAIEPFTIPFATVQPLIHTATGTTTTTLICHNLALRKID